MPGRLIITEKHVCFVEWLSVMGASRVLVPFEHLDDLRKERALFGFRNSIVLRTQRQDEVSEKHLRDGLRLAVSLSAESGTCLARARPVIAQLYFDFRTASQQNAAFAIIMKQWKRSPSYKNRSAFTLPFQCVLRETDPYVKPPCSPAALCPGTRTPLAPPRHGRRRRSRTGC